MSADPPLHVVLAGGVTGGHLYPGLAVAQALVKEHPRARITFLGTGRPWERQAVRAAGFDYHAINSAPLGREPRGWFRCLRANASGYWAARRFFSSNQVHAVLGLGGYASLPTGQAALRRGIPLVLLEPNAVAGRANRWLSRRASAVCGAFSELKSQFARPKVFCVTGTPVRQAAGQPISPAPSPLRPTASATRRLHPGNMAEYRTPREPVSPPSGGGAFSFAALGERPADLQTALRPLPRPRLLVLGGSQGASRLNLEVARALKHLNAACQSWDVIHLAGAEGVSAAMEAYCKAGVTAEVRGYEADLPPLLATCQAVISRAGGATLAELAMAGVPAVLCPYPHAKDDHQRRNAAAFAAAGACLVVDEFPTGDASRQPFHLRLADTLQPLLALGRRREQLSQGLRRLARPQAAQAVAQALLNQIAVQQETLFA